MEQTHEYLDIDDARNAVQKAFAAYPELAKEVIENTGHHILVFSFTDRRLFNFWNALSDAEKQKTVIHPEKFKGFPSGMKVVLPPGISVRIELSQELQNADTTGS